MDRGLVSVIIPVYNCGDNVRKCVESILENKYEHTEIILVNDGSTDNSNEVCVALAKEHSGIKYYSQENQGVSVARNVGIKNASGDYIIFVDGDDIVLSNMISDLLGGFDDGIDIVCGDYIVSEYERAEYFFPNKIVARNHADKEELFIELFNANYRPEDKRHTWIGVPWAKAFRTNLIKNNKILFDTKLRRLQDNVFNMCAFHLAKGIVYIHKAVYYYNVDHITSYKAFIGYSPGILKEVSRIRFEYIDKYSKDFSSNVIYAFYMETYNYIMSSCRYICVNNSNTHFCRKEIKELLSFEIYRIVLDKGRAISSFKYRLYFFILRHKWVDIIQPYIRIQMKRNNISREAQ